MKALLPECDRYERGKERERKRETREREKESQRKRERERESEKERERKRVRKRERERGFRNKKRVEGNLSISELMQKHWDAASPPYLWLTWDNKFFKKYTALSFLSSTMIITF